MTPPARAPIRPNNFASRREAVEKTGQEDMSLILIGVFIGGFAILNILEKGRID